MPAPTFQAAGTAASGTGAISVAWPAHQADDIGILLVATENQSVATPSGWNTTGLPAAQGNGTAANDASARLTAFWRRAQSGAESNATAADPGDVWHGRIFTLRGCHGAGSNQTTSPIDVSSGTSSAASTAVTFPSVTTTGVNRLILLAVADSLDSTSTARISGTTNANLSSIQERGESGTTNSGGAGISLVTALKATAGATGTSTATIASSAQGRMTIAFIGTPDDVDITGSLVAGALTVSGAISDGTPDPPAFVQFDSTPTITVQDETALLVLVVTRNADVGAGATATWDGIDMEVANNSNVWTQVYYLLGPPAGAGEFIVSGTNVEFFLSAQYSGDGLEFVSAQQSDDVDSFSLSPSGPSVMIYGAIAFSTAHSALGSNTERFDTNGSYFCDRIESSGGTFSVGITDGDAPAAVGVIFEGPSNGASLTGSLSAGAVAVSGTVTTSHSLSGALTTGEAAVSGSLTTSHTVSGALTIGEVAVSGSLQTPHNVSGSLSSPAAGVSGNLTTSHAVTGSLSVPALQPTGIFTTSHSLSGTLTSGAAQAAGIVQTPKDLTGGLSVTGAQVAGGLLVDAGLTGSVSVGTLAVSGTATSQHAVTGNVSTAAVQAFGDLVTSQGLEGNLELATLSVTGTVTSSHAVTGSLTVPPPTAVGAITTPHSLSGVLQAAPVSVSGNISQINESFIDGSVATGAFVVDGALGAAALVDGALGAAGLIIAGDVAVEQTLSGALLVGTLQVSGAGVSDNLLAGSLQVAGLVCAGAISQILEYELFGSLGLAPVSVAGEIEAVQPPALFPGGALAVAGATSEVRTVNNAQSSSTGSITGRLTIPGSSGSIGT